MIRFESLAIGDELLTGQIADTNSQFVAHQLFLRGHTLSRQTVVSDSISHIKSVISEISNRAQVVFCFGGLGPTSDDRTVDTVADILKCEVAVSEPAYEKMKVRYQAISRSITPESERQVRFPAAFSSLSNSVGLAPGFFGKIGSCLFIFFPGVPSEMKAMVEEHVWSLLSANGFNLEDPYKLEHLRWRCFGLAESELQSRLNTVEQSLPANAWLGYRASNFENQLTLYLKTTRSSRVEDLEKMNQLKQAISEKISPWVFSTDGRDMEDVVVEMLLARRQSLALAESCTGGLVAHRLARVPNASHCLWGGVTTYQNDAKTKLLGVKLSHPDTAVSSECSLEMAQSIQKISGSHWGAAITGYMGPSGGTIDNPDGTIFVAVQGPKCTVKSMRLSASLRRAERQWVAASQLLWILLESLRSE